MKSSEVVIKCLTYYSNETHPIHKEPKRPGKERENRNSSSRGDKLKTDVSHYCRSLRRKLCVGVNSYTEAEQRTVVKSGELYSVRTSDI